MKPWSNEKRECIKKAIDKEAAKLVKRLERLGCYTAMVICSFEDEIDPTELHIQSGGSTPMPPADLLRRQIVTFETAQERAQEMTDAKLKIN